ncbi:OsmC family protein [Paenisporosarcina quisquiliarum]|uniref:OsmC family protein n=1 Tax=Paenisporosarcina quisquiliarum TaxID=365346 RepID=A0A9X3REQ8_9BACL|nr:OsmC family protein [Paenisporosarcina quisquiliarum]MCZ8537857.1 OsmC family protein [Paenisporosarcina quisquiliarum]
MKFTIENEKIVGELGFGSLPISPNDTIGYRPYELFVSSLIGCSGTLLGNILKKKRVEHKKIEMEVSSVRNPDHANRIEQLSITAYVQSDQPLSEQNAQKITDLVVKNCGMIQSVINSMELTFTIKTSTINGDVS